MTMSAFILLVLWYSWSVIVSFEKVYAEGDRTRPILTGVCSQVLLKGHKMVNFRFRIFPQDFCDFESSYPWNGNRY